MTLTAKFVEDCLLLIVVGFDCHFNVLNVGIDYIRPLVCLQKLCAPAIS